MDKFRGRNDELGGELFTQLRGRSDMADKSVTP